MVGKNRELHSGFVGEIGDGVEAGQCRNRRAAAGIDENFFAFEQCVTDLKLMRANKSGVATMEAKVRALVDLLLLATAKAENDFVFLRHNFGQIDADIRSANTPARGVSRIVSDLRAVDYCCGGRQAGVDAGAAQMLLLDERDGPSQVGEPISERIAGLAGADDDGVVFHTDEPPEWNDFETYHRMQRQQSRNEELLVNGQCCLEIGKRWAASLRCGREAGDSKEPRWCPR